MKISSATERTVCALTDRIPVAVNASTTAYYVDVEGLNKSITTIVDSSDYTLSTFAQAEAAYLAINGRAARVGDAIFTEGAYGMRLYIRTTFGGKGIWRIFDADAFLLEP